jgi:nitrate/nitrite transporter NarK
MGIQGGSGNFGVLLAFIFVGSLAHSFTWKTPLYAYSLLCVLLGLVAYLSVREIKTKIESPQKVGYSLWKKTLLDIKEYIPGFFFGGACWGITIFYAPSLLNHKFHMSLSVTGIFLALWIGTGTIITYLFGILSQKIGRWRLSLIGFTGATCCLYFLGTATSQHVAVISLFFFGLFLFLTYPALKAFVGEKITSKNQAVAFSLAANIQMIAASIAVLISGYLADRFGISSTFLFLAVLGTMVAVYYLIKHRKGISARH